MNWKERMDIEANIETIWRLFEWDNQQRIMPQVVENKLIEETEEKIGTKFQQKYREGKRIETYIVEVLEHEDAPSKKHLKIGFTLAKTFNIHAAYTLLKKEAHHTVFEYSGSNEGINLLGKIMLKLSSTKGNQKVVTDFMKRVQQEAMKDERNAV